MVQTADVRNAVERYLAGEQSLRDMAVWLAREGWDLRDSAPTAPALEVIQALELHLAEYTSGHRRPDELRACFLHVIHNTPVETVWTTINAPLVRRSSESSCTQLTEAVA